MSNAQIEAARKLREGAEGTDNHAAQTSLTDTMGNMFWLVFSIYVTAFGYFLSSFLKTGFWNWEVIIIATIVDVIPVVKSLSDRKANIKIDIIRKEHKKIIVVKDTELDTLKQKHMALEIQKGILEYDVKKMNGLE